MTEHAETLEDYREESHVDFPVIAPDSPTHYTDDDRRQVVTLYLTLGNMAEVSRQTNIPTTTIFQWIRSEWWEPVAETVRRAVTNDVRARINATLLRSLDETMERLENGDEIGGAWGTRRVKMRGRDAAQVTAIMFDKLAMSLAAPRLEAMGTKIETLADQLEKLSGQVNAKVVNSE